MEIEGGEVLNKHDRSGVVVHISSTLACTTKGALEYSSRRH